MIGITLIVWRGALAYYFSQDDFGGLARARGLAPRLIDPNRWLSHQAYWDLMRPFGIASAWAYHAISIAAHAACAVALHALLRRRFARPAAFLAAAFFATHPMLFTAVHWASAVGDPLALLFALIALGLALGNRHRVWALPCLGLSLLFKESCLLLPAVVFAHQQWGTLPDRRNASRGLPRTANRPDLVLVGMWGITAIAGAHLVLVSYGANVRNALAAASGAAAPYALGDPRAALDNALTYLGWTANLWFPTVRAFSDSVDPAVWPWAFGLLAVWALGLVFRRLRDRGWIATGITYAALLLPVLPLRNHTYHYYLDASLIGIAWGIAAAGDAALTARRIRERAVTWAAAGALALLFAVNSLALVHKIETMPFVIPELRADPTIDRSRIARNAFESLRAAHVLDGMNLVFWSPTSAPMLAGTMAGRAAASADRYYAANLRAALLDGLAIRVMFPGVHGVSFAPPETSRSAASAESTRVAVYTPGGHLKLLTIGEFDSMQVAVRAPNR